MSRRSYQDAAQRPGLHQAARRLVWYWGKADIDGERTSDALVHGLRHTFANANVSVYTLMKLLGHESMVTSQRYVDGAGTDTRAAAELNPLYELLTTDQWE